MPKGFWACRGSLYGMLHSPALEITWAQVAAMCCGAARGMLHLHAHSILHRDLKSGDFLLMPSVIWNASEAFASASLPTLMSILSALIECLACVPKLPSNLGFLT